MKKAFIWHLSFPGFPIFPVGSTIHQRSRSIVSDSVSKQLIPSRSSQSHRPRTTQHIRRYTSNCVKTTQWQPRIVHNKKFVRKIALPRKLIRQMYYCIYLPLSIQDQRSNNSIFPYFLLFSHLWHTEHQSMLPSSHRSMSVVFTYPKTHQCACRTHQYSQHAAQAMGHTRQQHMSGPCSFLFCG